ncbi:predicted protein [Histoplasma mississippiense (nom. inval.)]|uniref:predicted protein n=1 Tax=Ajellomyces capsulatus (strain NAm1 / WU24) TaxID=2059318 RepID=UPI000157C804|nr:predicted protein [Histoplasma mississippiense (nom. inval.)]EDN09176.1 predicted protein [Histoplasma mississippiense (nom. inval.)]
MFERVADHSVNRVRAKDSRCARRTTRRRGRRLAEERGRYVEQLVKNGKRKGGRARARAKGRLTNWTWWSWERQSLAGWRWAWVEGSVNADGSNDVDSRGGEKTIANVGNQTQMQAQKQQTQI